MNINSPPWPTGQAAKTERAAIREGWGPTLRLLTLRVVAPTPWVLVALQSAPVLIRQIAS